MPLADKTHQITIKTHINNEVYQLFQYALSNFLFEK